MRTSPRADDRSNAAAVLDAELLRSWPMPVERDGDKYSRGTVLVIGGSPSTPGAVVLCGSAALRMGAGRLQIATADAVAEMVAMAVVESRTIGIPTTSSGGFNDGPTDELAEAIRTADAVVVGPGMLPDRGTVRFIEGVLECVSDNSLVVLDALALTNFGDVDNGLRQRVASQLLMTPNKQEAEALVDAPCADHDEALRCAANATGAVLSSFGIVQSPDGRRWRTVGNPAGLGTSGSGDVLAGLVGGAASRSGDRLQSACWATFAHIEAGRRLAESVGELGYLARDLLHEIPRCLPR